MTQQELIFAEVPVEKFSLLTKEELIIYLKGEQSLRIQLQNDNANLRAFNEELKQKSYSVSELLITVKNKFFGKSSERSPKPKSEAGQKKSGDKEESSTSERALSRCAFDRAPHYAGRASKLWLLRYPNARYGND